MKPKSSKAKFLRCGEVWQSEAQGVWTIRQLVSWEQSNQINQSHTARKMHKQSVQGEEAIDRILVQMSHQIEKENVGNDILGSCAFFGCCLKGSSRNAELLAAPSRSTLQGNSKQRLH